MIRAGERQRPIRPGIRTAFLLLLLAASGVSGSATVESLKGLLGQTRTARAGFTQSVTDAQGRPIQKATGTMQFSRPGKFRWEYEKPYEQVIVSDGQHVWLYDKDLNQVTVRQYDRALGSTPAALLAGSNEVEESYRFANLGARDGLEWLEAVPRAPDTPFERIRLGFGPSGLQAMELRDSFGQTTVIRFSNLERNVKLSDEAFRFTPPAGADVIRE